MVALSRPTLASHMQTGECMPGSAASMPAGVVQIITIVLGASGWHIMVSNNDGGNMASDDDGTDRGLAMAMMQLWETLAVHNIFSGSPNEIFFGAN